MVGPCHVVTAHTRREIARQERTITPHLERVPRSGSLLEDVAAQKRPGRGLVPRHDARPIWHGGFGRKILVGGKAARLDANVHERAVTTMPERHGCGRRFRPSARSGEICPQRFRGGRAR
jgi:hypothetical protein